MIKCVLAYHLGIHVCAAARFRNRFSNLCIRCSVYHFCAHCSTISEHCIVIVGFIERWIHTCALGQALADGANLLAPSLLVSRCLRLQFLSHFWHRSQQRRQQQLPQHRQLQQHQPLPQQQPKVQHQQLQQQQSLLQLQLQKASLFRRHGDP